MSISNFGAAGVRPGVCTSTTRPTNPYTGQIIYETDTELMSVWNGSFWEPKGNISIFPSSSARATSLPAPTEGMVTYLQDVDELEVYNGSSWLRVVVTSDDEGLTMAGNINPSATNSYDLGTTSLRWRNIYTQDLHLSNGIGDYTVIEGEENLYLVNNLTNKAFKFALIEVPFSEVPPKSEG